MVDEATINVTVVDAPASPSSEKTILFVGDSTTTNGEWPNELMRMLATSTPAGYTYPAGIGLQNLTTIGYRQQQYC